ncbi:MAG: photosynthetic reaction center subunit H [Piscinibacter sp.]|uniref:photosynthetic reaction center subunit H n=1 Tax=Piscinibacter sp. TaxID=1903157 RepID=UPI003D10E38B
MGTGAITQYIDVAQLVLYLFWIFFAGLIYYLAAENHREGYPMETDIPGGPKVGGWPVPAPKTFVLPDGREVSVPDLKPDPHVYSAEPAHQYIGAPLVPVGDPMFAAVGPGAYARRRDEPDMDYEGHPRIVPLRDMPKFSVAKASTDPRGLPVVGADGVVGATVADIWVDHSENIVRYIEIEAPSPTGPRRALLPMTFARVHRDRVAVKSVLGHQLAMAPAPRQPDRVTLLEEEKIAAYYGAGTLYATPARQEPLL